MTGFFKAIREANGEDGITQRDLLPSYLEEDKRYL